MKPRIKKFGNGYLCQGTVYLHYLPVTYIGYGNSIKEAYEDFSERARKAIDNWKREDDIFKKWDLSALSTKKCLSCGNYHPVNMACPHMMTVCY